MRFLALVIVFVTFRAPLLPGQGPVPEELAQAQRLLAERKFKEAARAFDAYARLNPSDPRGYWGAAQAWVRIRRFHEATLQLQLAQQLEPENPGITYDLAACLQNQARWGEALVQWRQVESLGAIHSDINLRPEVPFNRGHCAQKLEQVPEALEALKRASTMAPNNLTYRLELAGTLLNAGHYEEAVTEFQALIERQPADAMHHYHLGVCYLQTGNEEKAEEELRSARRLDQQRAEISLKLGKLYQRQKKYDLAYSLYLEASEKNPLEVEAWYNLARISSLRGNPEDSKTYQERHDQLKIEKDKLDEQVRNWNRRISNDPQDLAAYFDYATLLIQNQRFADAQERLMQLLAVAPRHEIALLNLASLLARQGDYQGAVLELDKLLELDPKNPFANLETGRALVFLGRWTEAQQHLETALPGMDPADERYPPALELLAEAARRNSRPGPAVDALEGFLAQCPPQHPLGLRLALRLAQLGQMAGTPTRAIPALEKMLGALSVEDSNRRQVLQLLAQLAQAAGDQERARRYLEALRQQ